MCMYIYKYIYIYKKILFQHLLYIRFRSSIKIESKYMASFFLTEWSSKQYHKFWDKNIPAPGLPRVCFGIFSRIFVMTFMFISWYLQDFWSNHHHVWSENVANSIVFYFFIIFHLYLHAFVNARSRKRLFQDALFFDGFAFRHRETTKNSDFSVFFWRSTFTACSLEESRRVQVQETRSVA